MVRTLQFFALIAGIAFLTAPAQAQLEQVKHRILIGDKYAEVRQAAGDALTQIVCTDQDGRILDRKSIDGHCFATFPLRLSLTRQCLLVTVTGATSKLYRVLIFDVTKQDKMKTLFDKVGPVNGLNTVPTIKLEGKHFTIQTTENGRRYVWNERKARFE